ncbi:MAG: hypothetical protein AAF567_07285 [Actinomycetota bacterium]
MTAHLQAKRGDAHQLGPGWLSGPSFDLTFIVATTAVALISAGVVVARPSLWWPILLADLWLLGYHHVISTYSRLAMDAESRQLYRWMLTWLPIAVLAGVAAIGYGVGVWALTTTYFYWQWWHYTRQSWGVHRVYERKAGLAQPIENPRLVQAVFYMFPAWGILWRSAQGSDEFLGADFKVLPVPDVLAHSVGVIAMIGVLWLAVNRFAAWRRGQLPVAQTLYLTSHFVVFGFGYLLIDDINHGWLAINIWHNAQYILFVWYFNNQKYRDGLAPEARTLSWLSQTRRIGIYLVASFIVSSVVYLLIRETIALAITPIVVYQTINFHHYIVDSFIWKVRKKPMQETLGLSASS